MSAVLPVIRVESYIGRDASKHLSGKDGRPANASKF